jgi:hypothetical protein
VVRALLRTQGYVACGWALAPEFCTRLSAEVRHAAEAGPHVVGPDVSTRAIALLEHSDSALGLLDEESLGTLVDEALGSDVILSRAEGVITPAAPRPVWQSDFGKPRQNLPARFFRPGIALWTALSAPGGSLEVLRASQHFNPAGALDEAELPAVCLTVQPGECLLLEGGVRYRLLTPQTIWLCFAFVRPWIKPEVLFFSALSKNRFERLGRRGRRWCGAQLGLPISVEEFLAIEAEALAGDFGRAKGSGI